MPLGKTIARTLSCFALAAFLLPAPASANDEVKVRFSWKLKGEYGPFYMALDKGYFAENKLDVRLGEGAGAPAALAALLQGQEDVVVLPGIFAVSAIQKGMPIKLIATYHPKTPVVIISHPENPARTPKEMEGKSIAVSVGETGTTYLGTFAKQNGVDFDKIKRVQVDAQSRVNYFLQKQVDMVTVYRSNDLPLLEARVGKSFPMIDMAEKGLAIPGLAAVSSDAIIAKRGDVLKRFLDAVDKGVAATKKDTKGASAALLKVWSAAPKIELVEAQVKETVAAIEQIPGRPIGWTDPKLISSTLDLLKTDQNIGTPKPVEAFINNDLLPRRSATN